MQSTFFLVSLNAISHSKEKRDKHKKRKRRDKAKFIDWVDSKGWIKKEERWRIVGNNSQ